MAKDILIIKLMDTGSGDIRFKIVTNNEMQRNVVDKLDLSAQLPVGTKMDEMSSET